MKRLRTRWADRVDENHVLEEYPRPRMERDSYVNLNGRWDYAITREGTKPEVYDGTILVPFSPEADLSGVNRQLQPTEYLWYHRALPGQVQPTEGKRWLLHFGAVDQYAVVYVNGKLLKRHLGGYLPFTVDVTEVLSDTANELLVMVQDYSDASYYSRGKQKLKRGGMFYTAQSGIWQTVWMEEVPQQYITDIIVTPLYDQNALQVKVTASQKELAEEVTITVSSEEMQPLQVTKGVGEEILIPLSQAHPWSPEDPFLYNIEVQMGADHVRSYAAMRKISVARNPKGIPRIFLNNQPYFQKGVLDQGYWPEGLYTPPCDEAMIYDIQTMKDLGFNMLRKHLKIEPQRWYYHCDRLGMLVWQDMVNGGKSYKSWYVTYLATAMEFFHIKMKDSYLWLLGRRNERGRRQFVEEMRKTIEHLYSHPSIVTWVIFNEGWGQFHANVVTNIAREMDHTRLIDQASGWFDQGGGDIHSIHDYFFPLKVHSETRATALTEFGGFSWRIPEHSMYQSVYGYRVYTSKKELNRGYRELIKKEILPNIPRGLSATIYTQLSDVEEEVNGILTYDREIVKIDEGDGGF